MKTNDIKQLEDTIVQLQTIARKNKLSEEDYFQLTKDIFSCILLIEEIDIMVSCRKFIAIMIPHIKKAISKLKNEELLKEYYILLKDSYGHAAKRSLEHFILYYEWDWKKENKLLENRYQALMPFVYYLSKLPFDENLEYVLASYMPSMGKSRCLCYYEAWRLGVQNDGCFLRISYSDMLVKGFSRSVIDIIKTEEYAFVFPELNYKKNKKIFTKETDDEWRLKTAGLLQSYMARSRDGQINGTRASLSIDIDDMLKDDKEALNMELHDDIWIKWVNVIQSRKTLGKKIAYVLVGTKWSPYDLICRVDDDLRSKHDFVKDRRFKYCEVSTDGQCAIINVPALDYETDESTCPNVISTQELKEIRNKNTPYFFSSVYQQTPIPPEGLDFDWQHLKTYDTKPLLGRDYDYSFASLDPARKGKNFVSMPIHAHIDNMYPLVDVLFEKKAMSDLYDDIVNKIIENKVIRLVLENNIDTSLKVVIEERLHRKSYYSCEIIEKYSLAKKEARIKDQQGVIRGQIVFPDRKDIIANSPMGRFMAQLTSFSFEYPNKYDDAIDSEAMFAHQIILDRASNNNSEIIDRKKLGI